MLCFAAELTAPFIGAWFYTKDAQVSPSGVPEGEGQGRDRAAVASAVGGQLQAGGDTELPRHRGGGQQPGQKSAGSARRLRSGQ